MIPQSLEYYRPDTIDEALDTWQRLSKAHKHPMYYGGGSEILTRLRLEALPVDSVIDLKGIPEVTVHEAHHGALEFGAGVRLSHLSERPLWPFLAATADRVADHTSRSHITLGGNLLSTLPYREALLPFLVSDSATLRIATPQGLKQKTLSEVLNQTIQLKPGEFLVSISVEGHEAKSMAHFRSHKMTRLDWIDYPLVTIAMTRRDNGDIRAAFSGWTSFPFSSSKVNQILSNHKHSPDARAERAVKAMPFEALNDIHGSSAYRAFVATYSLSNMLKELEA